MSALTDLRCLIELASLTEDRTDGEQRALLRLALRVDLDANKLTVTNRRDRTEPAWRLVGVVLGTRELIDGQHEVSLSTQDARRWLQSVEQWEAFRLQVAS